MALFSFTPFILYIRSLMAQFDSYTFWNGFVIIQKEKKMAWIFLKDPLNFHIFTQLFTCFVLDACNTLN